MLFCCLQRNVDASCHKHFVVVTCEQQTTPLARDECHQVRKSTKRATKLVTAVEKCKYEERLKKLNYPH